MEVALILLEIYLQRLLLQNILYHYKKSVFAGWKGIYESWKEGFSFSASDVHVFESFLPASCAKSSQVRCRPRNQ